jgi:replicative DNA helicase
MRHDEIGIEVWSREAEQSVLGGLLADNSAFDRVADLIQPESFYDQRHGWIFAAMATLITANKPADAVTTLEALRERGQEDECGGLQVLEALAQCVPSAANARRYAEVVAEKAARRRLIALADKALGLAKGPGSAAEILDQIAASFVTLERGQQRRAPKVVADLLTPALDRYEALSRGDVGPCLPTGLRPLDRLMLGGLRPGKVYGIAARPSVGKSSAARAILMSVALAGAPTLLLSQEMPDDEIADALVAQAGRIDGGKLQTGSFADEDWTRLVDGVEKLRNIPLYVDDQGGLTLAQIRTKARAVKGLRVLAVDYLQLCTSGLKGKSTNDEVAEISKGLKALALEQKISVVLLSQLNREVEKRADKEPQLSDLRDSGAIEQDLDFAALLWTVDDGNDSRLVGWKVAKHRGGPKGRFGMRWNPAINDWRESDEPLRAAAGQAKATVGFE